MTENPTSAVGEEARRWFRHRVSAPLYFMITREGKPLDPASATLDGTVVDVSESGFRFKSPMPLSEAEMISFEIAGQEGPVFSGVAEVIHGNNELIYGVQFIKIRKH